jgi:hypothetical protein
MNLIKEKLISYGTKFKKKIRILTFKLFSIGEEWIFIDSLLSLTPFFKNFELKSIFWLDTVRDNISYVIREENFVRSVGPTDIFGNKIEASVSIPKIALYHFTKTIVSSESSHLMTGNAVVMERVISVPISKGNYASGFVWAHSADKALTRKSNNIESVFEKSLFLDGSGSWNYYHWMIEILPKLKYLDLVESLGVETILVSKMVKRIPAFSRTLELAIDGRMKVIYLEPNKSYKVEDLYHITAPSNIAFNLNGSGYSADFCYFYEDALSYVRNLIFKQLSHPGDFPKKIFLARKGKIRAYNQDEVYGVLKEKGFKEIYIEDYSLEEQAMIFRGASEIVGPTGAGWTNLIFASPGTKCLCWMSEQLEDFAAFSNLASFAKVELRYIKYKSLSQNSYRSGYLLNIDLVKKALRELNI